MLHLMMKSKQELVNDLTAIMHHGHTLIEFDISFERKRLKTKL